MDSRPAPDLDINQDVVGGYLLSRPLICANVRLIPRVTMTAERLVRNICIHYRIHESFCGSSRETSFLERECSMHAGSHRGELRFGTCT